MIYHFKSLVLVRKGHAFYATLYQEVFFCNPGGGGSLNEKMVCNKAREKVLHSITLARVHERAGGMLDENCARLQKPPG